MHERTISSKCRRASASDNRIRLSSCLTVIRYAVLFRPGGEKNGVKYCQKYDEYGRGGRRDDQSAKKAVLFSDHVINVNI